MGAKEYLSQIRILDTIINQKLAELDNLHDIATAIGSFDYSRDRVQASPSGEAPYVKAAEKAVKLDGEINELIDRRFEIINSIQCLEDHRYTEILYKHYVEYKKFGEIQKETNYALSYLWRLHSEALDEMQKYIDKHRF